MLPQSVSNNPLNMAAGFEGYTLEPVATPTLSMYNKQLGPIISESTPRVSDYRFENVDIEKEQLVEPRLDALCLSAAMSHLTMIEPYIASYWQHVDLLTPVIHRGTFDPAANILVSTAMAALGTQYHNSATARQKGVELHDYCKKTIDHVSCPPSILRIFELTKFSV